MMSTLLQFLTVQNLVFALLLLALGAAVVRLVLGPDAADRALALDLIAVIAVGLITVHSIATDEAILFDAALVVALVGFLGTVTFARYLERRARDD